MLELGSRQNMTGMKTKRAKGKCIANALVCQLCWTFLLFFQRLISEIARSIANKFWHKLTVIEIYVHWKLCYRKDAYRPTDICPKCFFVGFCSDWPCDCEYKIWSPCFTRSWDNRSDWSFGWGLRTSNLGKGEGVDGRGRYRPKERWRVPIGPHSNFYSIFTRFRDIAALLCSPERHVFPTALLVSPKFPHVSVEIGGSPFGYKERKCWANK